MKPDLILCMGNEILSDDSFGFTEENWVPRKVSRPFPCDRATCMDRILESSRYCDCGSCHDAFRKRLQRVGRCGEQLQL